MLLCLSLKSAFKVNQKTHVFQEGEKEGFLDFEWSRLTYSVPVYWLHVCLPGGNLVCAVSCFQRDNAENMKKEGPSSRATLGSPCDLIKEITLGPSQKKKKKAISLLLLLNSHMLPIMFSEIRYTYNYSKND